MAASMLIGDGNCLIETADKQQLLLTRGEAVGLASSLIFELARGDVGLFVVLNKTMMGYCKLHGPPEVLSEDDYGGQPVDDKVPGDARPGRGCDQSG